MLAGHDTSSMVWVDEDGWRRHKEEEGGGAWTRRKIPGATSMNRAATGRQQSARGNDDTMVGRSWHDWTTRARGTEGGGGAGGWAGNTVYGEFIKLRSHPYSQRWDALINSYIVSLCYDCIPR